MRPADLDALHPDRFVAARDALADSLRETDPAGARHVQGLRKPTVSLWVVNQLARRRPKEVARLVSEGVRDRSLLDRLVKAAAPIFEEIAAPATAEQLRRVEETLLASPLVSPAERAALLEGRLGKALVLGDLDTMLALAASRKATARTATPRAPRARRGRSTRENIEKQREEALHVARKAASIARETASRLADAADAAEERARRAKADAQAALRAARASARDARAKAVAAQEAVRATARATSRRRS